MLLNPDIEQRMQDRIDKSGDCWLWTGNVNDKGYGYIKNNGKRERVHRVAYALAHGPIPPGLQVEHECRVRNCVKPAHLRLATNKQNNENKETLWRGVSRRRRKHGYKYVAGVVHHGKYYYCGTHDTAGAANAAVVDKRLELFTHNSSDRANDFCKR